MLLRSEPDVRRKLRSRMLLVRWEVGATRSLRESVLLLPTIALPFQSVPALRQDEQTTQSSRQCPPCALTPSNTPGSLRTENVHRHSRPEYMPHSLCFGGR